MIAVDSPPGMTRPSSPSSSSGLRTSTASAPSRRSIAACSRKLPCTARTPIVTREILRSGERAPAARQEQADRDERERVETEDQSPEPRAKGLGAVESRLAAEDEDRHQVEEREEELVDAAPLRREMRRRLQQAPRAEHDPARPRQPVPEGDVAQAGDAEQHEIEVAVTEEPDQAAADRQPGR